ncbi:MAG: PfkB family carbohydrate kinase [Acidobacteria bacterium]|nr:PfkB family carbohydrate kinase [Acidobacteriota bacterium]
MRILVAGEINPDLILQGYHTFPELGKEVLVDDLNLTLGSAAAICAAGLARLGAEVLAGFEHVHISSYYLQENLRPGCAAIFERASKLGLTTSLDTGYDPSETWAPDIYETLKFVDIFLPNEVELRHIGRDEDPVKALQSLANGRTQVVAKLGSRGAMALDHGQPVYVPAFKVKPVDTTGAGDSFNAGFLHAWSKRMALPEAMRFASACGGLSTQGMGGTGCQATEAEALEFIRSQESAVHDS